MNQRDSMRSNREMEIYIVYCATLANHTAENVTVNKVLLFYTLQFHFIVC